MSFIGDSLEEASANGRDGMDDVATLGVKTKGCSSEGRGLSRIFREGSGDSTSGLTEGLWDPVATNAAAEAEGSGTVPLERSPSI
jgi:hypothetical protein